MTFYSLTETHNFSIICHNALEKSDCSHHVKIIVACTRMRQMNHFDTGYCISNNNSIHHSFLHLYRKGRLGEEKDIFHNFNGLFYLHPGLTKHKTKSFICSQ